MSLLLISLLFAKQAQSQSDEGLFNQNGDLAKVSVAYKDKNAEIQAYNIWKAQKLQGKWGGQCVKFVREFSGYEQVRGLARNFKTNTTTPQIGAIGKTDESASGHLFYILDIQKETLYVADSNWNWDERIRTRYINLNNPHILGYFVEGGE